MNKAIIYDTSYGTSNLGDFIINEAVARETQQILSGYFTLKYPTHTPLMYMYQNIKNNVIKKNLTDSKLRFFAGTNLFKTNLMLFTPDWNINIFTKNLYKDTVSLGCGMDGDGRSINWYTRTIYKTVLSKDYIHSVRDENTKVFLEKLGFKAINTGCPTTWCLTKSHCLDIPKTKSNSVVFTLTDYKQDNIKDQELINTLNLNYKEVYFWIQGTEDYDYFKSLSHTENIKTINPDLESYRKVLTNGDIDYVGTRLHAGIFAMQHKRRSIILIVDNRARDIQRSYNINAIERNDISSLNSMINSQFKTEVKIDIDKINEWKNQFLV